MVKRRTLGLAAFAGAAVGGAALGYLAERRLVHVGPPTEDPEWAELSSPPPVELGEVEAFDGTRLRVVSAGPADAPPVVLVHGYAMSWRFWHYQVRDLVGEFRVVAYDLRGHADSEPAASGDYTTSALARDLRTVLDACVGDEPAVVAGHSMGGMTVMAFADEFPGQVQARLAGAVLVNTAASKVIYRGLLTVLAGAVKGMRRLPRRPTRGWPLPRPDAANDLSHLLTRRWALTPDASPALVGLVEELAASCPIDVMGGFGRMMATLDLQAALEHLTVPTLVVAGGRDWLTPARQSGDLAAALPDARFETLPDAGHSAPLEAHELFTGLLREHARRCFDRPDAGAA
jgi:pimeloyl-ACP methyl ester carboxylesterase